jgi:hypothetical protein
VQKAKPTQPPSPAPRPDLSDMDQFHKLVQSNRLADLFVKIMRGEDVRLPAKVVPIKPGPRR